MIKYIFCLFILTLFSCISSPRYTSSYSPSSSSSQDKSYTVKKIIKGVSSWYGQDFHGNLTANGEVYDMYGLTAAHKTMPYNTWVRVTNLDNEKSLILRINDRGPYAKGRILDCSYGAAKKLGFVEVGTANVKIEVIEWGDGEYMHH